jgi:hypothetical protein
MTFVLREWGKHVKPHLEQLVFQPECELVTSWIQVRTINTWTYVVSLLFYSDICICIQFRDKHGSFISLCTSAPVCQLHSTIPEGQEELLTHQGKVPIPWNPDQSNLWQPFGEACEQVSVEKVLLRVSGSKPYLWANMDHVSLILKPEDQ